MSSYTPLLPAEIAVNAPVKPSMWQRLDANDQAVPSPQVLLSGALNTWTAPETKYYLFYITGRGMNGASGGTGGQRDPGSIPTVGGAGGRAGSTGIVRLLIIKNTVFTATFTSGVGSTSITDGTNTYSAGNQGGACVNCDISLLGGGYGRGGSGGTTHGVVSGTLSSIGNPGESGGSSFWGGGGLGGAAGAAVGNGGAGGASPSYGGGGGNGGGGGSSNTSTPSGGAGGAGGAGCVLIIG